MRAVAVATPTRPVPPRMRTVERGLGGGEPVSAVASGGVSRREGGGGTNPPAQRRRRRSADSRR